MLERLRKSGLTDFAAKAGVSALFALLSVNLFQDFLRTGHVTGLLLLASESLVVILTITRRKAAYIDASAKAAMVTFVSVTGPWLLRTTEGPALLPDAVTAFVSGIGLLIVLVAKMTLGRSFGLIPANRGVVVQGPYGFVRHPIYCGYLLTHVAFLVAQPSLWNVAVLVVADGTLIVRALMEERVLQQNEAYASYCRRVSWHLVPGVF